MLSLTGTEKGTLLHIILQMKQGQGAKLLKQGRPFMFFHYAKRHWLSDGVIVDCHNVSYYPPKTAKSETLGLLVIRHGKAGIPFSEQVEIVPRHYAYDDKVEIVAWLNHRDKLEVILPLVGGYVQKLASWMRLLGDRDYTLTISTEESNWCMLTGEPELTEE